MVWEVEVDNIAGIRSAETALEPGVNAVRGTNWQGKSSFVTALETVMGTETELTEGAEEGGVTLSTEDRTVSVRLVEEEDGITRRGEPYLETEKRRTAASLYAFLDDDNAVRKAVRNDENLESVLTRPLEFENIDERIADRSAERDRVERELDRVEDAARKLPDKQATVTRLEEELAELRERREEMQGEGEGASLSDRREELSDLKAQRDSTEERIRRLERTVERTREKLADRRSELDDLDVPDSDGDLASEIADREERKDRLERDAELLQSIYAPTKRLLDEDRLDLLADVDRDVLADTVVCGICGSETTREDVEDHLDRLSDRIADLRKRAKEYEEEVSDLRKRRRDVERSKRRRSDLEEAVAELETTLEEREASLETARDRYESLQDRVDDLSESVERAGDELTDVESRIKYTERQLEDEREELGTLESRVEKRDALEAEREDLTDEIRRLRDRKSELKRRTREAFDDAIRGILSRFDVGFEMGRLTPEFDLVVARDGREASLSALSEGELELLGIVTALAGYEAFDATDEVPVMVLDGLGGIADDNLGTLIQYLEGRAEYLVFTTHPENTAYEDNTVDPGPWDVVSPDVGTARN